MRDSFKAKLESLSAYRHSGYGSHPDLADDINRAETALGRLLDPTHRRMLLEVGGGWGFKAGAVPLGATGLFVRTLLGLGGDWDIVGWNSDYAGAIPSGWYPLALDDEGHLFEVTNTGTVHHVVLSEEQSFQSGHPTWAGREVAENVARFFEILATQD